MIWIVILIVVFIIVKFLSDWKKQNAKLLTEGGVITKYSELINILKSNSDPKIIQSDIDTYSFAWVSPNAINKFQIMQTFAFVTIKWAFKGKISFENKTINLSKEWKFPDTTNQEKIAEKVLTEMTEIFNKSEFGKYSLFDIVNL